MKTKTARFLSVAKNLFSKHSSLPPRFFRAEGLPNRRPGIIVAVTVLAFIAGTDAGRAADGRLDRAFGNHGKVTTDFNQTSDLANAVALQPDGKIVAVGTTYANNDYSEEDFAIARYNSDGSLDATFGVGGRVTTDFPGLAAVASSVIIQPDGKILVAGGAFPQFTFAGDFKLVRYNADGSLDMTFGSGGIVTTNFPAGSYAFALALQSDGKIVAAGTVFVDFQPGESNNTDFALARYNPDGSPDTTFGAGGQVMTDFNGFEDDAYAVLIQPDGKIVAVGSANASADYYDFAAARYLSNGTIDTAFGTAGRVRTDFGDANLDIAYSAALQTDGKIVAAGMATLNNGAKQNFGVLRYNANGTLDPTFHHTGLATIDFGNVLQAVNQVLIQTDGKIITVGSSNGESSEDDFLLARLNGNGSLDRTFGRQGTTRTSFGPLNDGASGAVLQPDGKIVAVGFTARTKDFPDMAMARYTNSGP